MRDRLIPALLIIFLVSAAASAMFMRPELMPVDRVVENATAYVKENPKDPQGYYVLARVHYFGYASKAGLVPTWPNWEEPKKGEEDKAKLPNIPGNGHGRPGPVNEHFARQGEAERRAQKELAVDDVRMMSEKQQEQYHKRVREIARQLQEDKWEPAPLPQPALDEHARQAIRHFHTAIKLDKANGLYHLGLAGISEQFADRAEAARVLPSGESEAEKEIARAEGWYRQQMLGQALHRYAVAYRLTIDEDRKLKSRPLAGLSELVSYEAIQGYERIYKTVEGKIGDKHLLVKMQADFKKLKAIPWGKITPIVFSFSEHAELSDLLADDDVTVAFDLDGTGRPQRWSWVKADTAILVWDPHGTGRVESGRQLFGSVTWWLLPGDGYRAMDLLDDNRDGELAGVELRGLAVWQDGNSNGVSDDGEVTAIEKTPIAALAVKPQSYDGDASMHEHGLRLKDGTRVPTYDWVATRKR